MFHRPWSLRLRRSTARLSARAAARELRRRGGRRDDGQLITAQRASWAGGPARVESAEFAGKVGLSPPDVRRCECACGPGGSARQGSVNRLCAQRVPNAYAYSGAGSCGGSRSRKRRSLAGRPGSRETDSLLEGRALVTGVPRLALQQFSKLKCQFHSGLALRSTVGLSGSSIRFFALSDPDHLSRASRSRSYRASISASNAMGVLASTTGSFVERAGMGGCSKSLSHPRAFSRGG